MSPAEQLRAAKALIDMPEKWTKGEYARGKSGGRVKALGRAPVCFCALGALGRAGCHDPADIGFSEGATWLAYQTLIRATPNRMVFEYNDDPATTHADIMALFDRAIEAAEKADA